MQTSLLTPGKVAGIVVPARKVDEQLLMAGCRVIESWGLKIKLGEYCVSKTGDYLAASDELRLQDLQRMLDDPDVDVIFCGRGGYGTTRILDKLDFSHFIKKPKPIIGFSDITALHLRLHKLGVESIHGPMPTQYAKAGYEESVNFLRDLLFGGVRDINANPHQLNKTGEASGQVIGGNLSLLADSMGTTSEPDTEGKILVIEEVDEYLYKVDRMMIQLKRASKLNKLAGLVVGHMSDMRDTELGFCSSVEQLIANNVKEFEYPLAFQFPIGHEAPNFAWKHGAVARLHVGAAGSVLNFIN